MAIEYNKFEDGTPVQFPKLTKPTTYRYANVRVDPDEYNKGFLLGPFSKNVPSTDLVNIKRKVNGEEITEVVQIAAIDIERPGQDPKFIDIKFEKNSGLQFTLDPKKPKDRKVYGYVETCNFNGSNDDRNPASKIYFFKVDTVADAKEDLSDRRDYLKAMNIVDSLEGDALVSLAVAKGVGRNQPEEVMRNLLFEMVDEDPVEFMDYYTSRKAEYEAAAREAVELGVLLNDTKKHNFAWKDTKEVIFQYQKTVGGSTYSDLADYMSLNPSVWHEIQTRIKAKRKSQ